MVFWCFVFCLSVWVWVLVWSLIFFWRGLKRGSFLVWLELVEWLWFYIVVLIFLNELFWLLWCVVLVYFMELWMESWWSFFLLLFFWSWIFSRILSFFLWFCVGCGKRGMLNVYWYLMVLMRFMWCWWMCLVVDLVWFDLLWRWKMVFFGVFVVGVGLDCLDLYLL